MKFFKGHTKTDAYLLLEEHIHATRNLKINKEDLVNANGFPQSFLKVWCIHLHTYIIYTYMINIFSIVVWNMYIDKNDEL